LHRARRRRGRRRRLRRGDRVTILVQLRRFRRFRRFRLRRRDQVAVLVELRLRRRRRRVLRDATHDDARARLVGERHLERVASQAQRDAPRDDRGRAAGSNEWIGTNNNGTRWAQADPYLFTPSPPEPELDEDGNPVEKEKPPPEEGEEAEEAEPEPFDPTPYVVVPDPTWVDDVGSSTQIDPDSMAKVTTRSDLVMIVEHETKSTLVYHADGTRAVCAPSEGCAWRIEKEGFAAVQRTRSVGVDGDVVVDLASAIATADVDGVVVLTLADGSVLATEVSGQIAYAPAWLETPEAAARGAFYTLVPIRPCWRGERRSLRTFPGVSLRPPLAFNPHPRRL
jgi:hypothetical protein